MPGGLSIERNWPRNVFPLSSSRNTWPSNEAQTSNLVVNALGNLYMYALVKSWRTIGGGLVDACPARLLTVCPSPQFFETIVNLHSIE